MFVASLHCALSLALLAGGVAFVVETLTDNRKRTAAAVRSLFTRAGGALQGTNSVMYLFNRRGIVWLLGLCTFLSRVCL